MSLPLRAFLMLLEPAGWSVTVCRDLEAVVEAWNGRISPTETVGILHVGFDRPPSQLFEEVAHRHLGRLLVTAAAKDALPKNFENSASEVGFVDGHSIFLATRGWGYQVLLAEEREVSRAANPSLEPEGWVQTFLVQHPELKSVFDEVRIFDDKSYLKHECHLDQTARYRSGAFRLRQLIAENSSDPCEFVRASPPWLLNKSFDTIDLSVRITNAFLNARIQSVRDLLAYDLNQLLHISNFGRRSVRDLYEALVCALNEGPPETSTQKLDAGAQRLLEAIEHSLSRLPRREADIVSGRMGFGRDVQTLQEIADHYKLTRERVRQLENKSLAQLTKGETWPRRLAQKLSALLVGREFPLPLIGLEAVDPWFSGATDSVDLFEYLLTKIVPGHISILRIEGIDYLGRLTQDDWQRTVKEANRILEGGANKGWTEAHCQIIVGGLLGDNAREFRFHLWLNASRLCHFVEQQPGSRILVSYGRGADQLVEAVLQESSEPLHFEKIAERASRRAGKPVDVRRAHNAAANVGILLGRGTFGLRQHVKILDGDQIALRDQLEQIILDGPEDRQWHSYELLSDLGERNVSNLEHLNKYIVDFLLSGSEAVRKLGRMTWAKANSSSQSRIDVRQAVISLLQSAGGPLTLNEIRQRLIAVRGVSANFQIYASDSVVRVDSERWGLNDRDAPIKRAEQSVVLDQLVGVLQSRQIGLHFSETKDALDNIPKGTTADFIFSLASTDDRLQCIGLQYVFLREWGEPRRENLSQAIFEILRLGDKLSVDEISREAQRRTLRACSKRAIESCLQAIDANYDPRSGNWSIPEAVSDCDYDESNRLITATKLAPVEWSTH